MPTVRIQHAVPDFAGWKEAFDRDPAGRQASGVRHYRVQRSVDDSNLVMIDLEFDELDRARAFVQTMERIWEGPGRAIMREPRAWVCETAEERDV